MPPDVTACADIRELGPRYAYLLGLYLGDGCLTEVKRSVFRLRITLDQRYPEIIEECAAAIESVVLTPARRIASTGYIEVYSFWKHWPCVFPQHAPGPKHKRPIVLRQWQARLVTDFAEMFLRGLIQSDGCRTVNSVWRPTADGRRNYRYPRYFFVNHSREIRDMFGWACDLLEIEWRQSNRYTLSVAKATSVSRLDAFVGPKQ